MRTREELFGIAPTSNQDAFDRVVEWFFGLKNPQSTVGNTCRYRAPSGRACAVGFMIPDALFRKEFECSRIPAVLRMSLELCGHFSAVNFSFLGRLQACHDASSSCAEFRERLQEVAEEYTLSCATLDSFPDYVFILEDCDLGENS